ncbi:MAG: PIN domain-containing protein [Promicromonosporaceae bacterium]|nr:PIN domain-containing protein [Promicromonosporaceae bacterium]
MASAAPVYLLDTNAVSDLIKRPADAVATRMRTLLPGQAAICAVVEGELRYGIAKANATAIERDLDALLVYLPTLALDAAVARRYGLLRAELEAVGTPIGANDTWIAAHALARGLTLVTANEVEFRRVNGLRVENWRN